MVETMLAAASGSGQIWSLSAMGHRLGGDLALALSLVSATLKIDAPNQGFPPASHVAICDTIEAVAVTARRKTCRA